MISLEQIVEGVVSLPPTPRILPKLQKLLRNPDSGIHEIISLIKVDAPMTAQIVRISNSAFYNTGEPVQSLEDAVNRIGFREVYRVASVAAAQQVMGEALPLYNMGKGELLEGSVTTAVLMVELGSRARRMDLDAAYTTGLLYSIGKVIINQYFLKHGLEVYDNSTGETIDEVWEKNLLGFNNAEVGGEILKKWNFPEEIISPVTHQFAPLESESFKACACHLAIAHAVVPVLRSCEGKLPDLSGLNIDPDILEGAALDVEKITEAAEDALVGLQEMSSLYN